MPARWSRSAGSLGAAGRFSVTRTAALPSRSAAAAIPDPLAGLSVEGFGLPDNLMIPGAVLEGGGHPIVLPPDGQDQPFDALDMFEICVGIAASKMNPNKSNTGAVRKPLAHGLRSA